MDGVIDSAGLRKGGAGAVLFGVTWRRAGDLPGAGRDDNVSSAMNAEVSVIETRSLGDRPAIEKS